MFILLLLSNDCILQALLSHLFDHSAVAVVKSVLVMREQCITFCTAPAGKCRWTSQLMGLLPSGWLAAEAAALLSLLPAAPSRACSPTAASVCGSRSRAAQWARTHDKAMREDSSRTSPTCLESYECCLSSFACCNESENPRTPGKQKALSRRSALAPDEVGCVQRLLPCEQSAR